MKICLLFTLGFWTVVIESGYFFPVLLALVLGMTLLMLYIFRTPSKSRTKQVNYKLHQFVLMPGYRRNRQGKTEYITTRKLAVLYELEPGDYILYPIQGYQKTEHHIILPPLNEGESYLDYKEEVLDRFYEQQAVS